MKYLQLILSALLLVCLLAMPYGYYVLVRFIATICFCILTLQYHDKKELELAIIFGSLTLLFQPFFKVALGRTMWNVVDVLVAIFLAELVISESKNKITYLRNMLSKKRLSFKESLVWNFSNLPFRDHSHRPES